MSKNFQSIKAQNSREVQKSGTNDGSEHCESLSFDPASRTFKTRVNKGQSHWSSTVDAYIDGSVKEGQMRQGSVNTSTSRIKFGQFYKCLA